jgi:hypothetical protein
MENDTVVQSTEGQNVAGNFLGTYAEYTAGEPESGLCHSDVASAVSLRVQYGTSGNLIDVINCQIER